MVASKEMDHATELDMMLNRMQDMVIDCKGGGFKSKYLHY